MIINDVFVGGESDSWNDEIDAQTCVNWHPVIARDKTVKALRRLPGIAEWADCSTIGTRTLSKVLAVYRARSTLGGYEKVYLIGHVDADTFLFAVDIAPNGTPGSKDMISILANSNIHTAPLLSNDVGDILIVREDNSTSYYAQNVNDLSLTFKTAAFGIHSLAYFDGYFFVCQVDTNQVHCTDFQGITISSTDYGSMTGGSGDVVTIASDRRNLWMFGERSIEVWYNAGNSGFPLLRNNSVFHEVGIKTRRSVFVVGGSIFFEGINSRGGVSIYMTEGFNIKVVSNEALNIRLRDARYDAHLTGFSHLSDNFLVVHTRLSLGPADTESWIYHINTGMWSIAKGQGTLDIYPISNHVTAGANISKPLFSAIDSHDLTDEASFSEASIYNLDFDVYTSAIDATTFACERISKHIYGQDNKALIHNRLELEFSKSASLAIALSYSDDDGDTWTSVSTLTVSDGRYVWRSLGRSRDRIYKITTSTNVEATLISSWLDAEQLDV